MKEIYSLVDKHFGEVIISAETRDILEEILCDEFMEAYRQEMQEAVDLAWIVPLNPTEDCHFYAQDIWNSLLTWNKSVYDIQRSNLI